MEESQGKVWRLGNNIDTDITLPTKYLVSPAIVEMKPYAFSPLRPELTGKIGPDDITADGKNLGCGSSCEQVSKAIKVLGIRAVIAKSFVCILFRSTTSSGLLLTECRDLPDEVNEGDILMVIVGEKIRTDGRDYRIATLFENLVGILSVSGLAKVMRKRNGLNRDENGNDRETDRR